MKKQEQRRIEVWADWEPMQQPERMGLLFAAPARGKEIFSFEYDSAWLKSGYAQALDPSLGLYHGPQYAPQDRENFGVFLDSAPDRWGRLLMRRREAQSAREEHRPERTLRESDFLLGVYDGNRMGALRFRLEPEGPFLDADRESASPPWASLHDLERASLELEKEGAEKSKSYANWLRMLVAPGSSLGGARPKAGVVDAKGDLWIAKFPSSQDDHDVGAWEYLVHQLARRAKIETPEAMTRVLGSRHHTFLSKRFDRSRGARRRIHFASAMTLLRRQEGDDDAVGASYLEIAEFLMRQGAAPNRDLEQLWRRIVFFICVSNTDDHLRNHGFLLSPAGWRLAPAYDMNPVAFGDGLRLNISESDNSQSLELAEAVAPYFRLDPKKAQSIIREVKGAVRDWRQGAKSLRLSSAATERMANAFRVAEEP